MGSGYMVNGEYTFQVRLFLRLRIRWALAFLTLGLGGANPKLLDPMPKGSGSQLGARVGTLTPKPYLDP